MVSNEDEYRKDHGLIYHLMTYKQHTEWTFLKLKKKSELRETKKKELTFSKWNRLFKSIGECNVDSKSIL